MWLFFCDAALVFGAFGEKSVGMVRPVYFFSLYPNGAGHVGLASLRLLSGIKKPTRGVGFFGSQLQRSKLRFLATHNPHREELCAAAVGVAECFFGTWYLAFIRHAAYLQGGFRKANHA